MALAVSPNTFDGHFCCLVGRVQDAVQHFPKYKKATKVKTGPGYSVTGKRSCCSLGTTLNLDLNNHLEWSVTSRYPWGPSSRGLEGYQRSVMPKPPISGARETAQQSITLPALAG